MLEISSKLIRDAVSQMATLPGIGQKTALRLVLHLLKQEEHEVELFSNAFVKLKKEIQFCKKCYNYSDANHCEICTNPTRKSNVICVVESIKDVMAIEATQQFFGLYHVLGGIISPMEGVGPNDLKIDELIVRCENDAIEEVIFALNSSMEGETTNFYINRKLKSLDLTISVLARGIAFGDALEYADEITLGRSIINRIPFDKQNA